MGLKFFKEIAIMSMGLLELLLELILLLLLLPLCAFICEAPPYKYMIKCIQQKQRQKQQQINSSSTSSSTRSSSSRLSCSYILAISLKVFRPM